MLGRGEKNDKENHFFISKYYEKKIENKMKIFLPEGNGRKVYFSII